MGKKILKFFDETSVVTLRTLSKLEINERKQINRMFREPVQTKIHVHGFKFEQASAEKTECVDTLVDALSPYSRSLVKK